MSAGRQIDSASGMAADDALLRTDASTLTERMRRGALSPVALMEATLARISACNGDINAICTVAEDAMALAEAAEAQLARHGPGAVGPLFGLPIGIKDVTPTAGLRTTYGSRLYADHVPDDDALLVRRLKAAGAIIVGKTNTPEMAVGAHTDNPVFGVTHNPWDLSRTVGGSTGGGAAALASGMIALADGTDVASSLRLPAAYCGVVGLRPSPSLVPRLPGPLPWDDIEVCGPMARTVADVALALQVMAGPDPGAPNGRRVATRDFVAAARGGLSSPILERLRQTDARAGRRIPDLAHQRPIRIGFCADISGRGIEPALLDAARTAMAQLGASDEVDVEEVTLDLSAGHRAFIVLRGLWMLGQHIDLLETLDDPAHPIGDNLAGNLRLGLTFDARAIAEAMRTRAQIFAAVADLLTRVDVLMTPTVAVPPFVIEDGPPSSIGGQPMETYIDWVAPNYLLTLTSLPVLAVPCGLDGDGLPAGVQIVGPVDGEELILAVGAHMQAHVAPTMPAVPTALAKLLA